MQQVGHRSAEKQEEHAMYVEAAPRCNLMTRYSNMSLSKAEHVGEMIYELMSRGKLDKEAFTRRMTQLDLCGPHGRVASCYVTWLLLKNTPDCPEKQFHMARNNLKLRAALQEEEESLTTKLAEGPAEMEARNACQQSLRTVQRVS